PTSTPMTGRVLTPADDNPSRRAYDPAIGGLVVIAKRYGRLANRLLLFAHFIGAAAEHGFTVLDPAFIAQARYFSATARTPVPRFPAGGRVPPIPGGRTAVYLGAKSLAMGLRVTGGSVRLGPRERLDLDDPAFLDLVARRRVLVVEGWHFRSEESCE